jgi:hypothetical protein
VAEDVAGGVAEGVAGGVAVGGQLLQATGHTLRTTAPACADAQKAVSIPHETGPAMPAKAAKACACALLSAQAATAGAVL